MNEYTFTAINVVVSMAVVFGIYKNKIDTVHNLVEKFTNLEIKIARLEEKINNLIIQNEKNV